MMVMMVMSPATVMTLSTYLQGLPSHHQCKGYVQTFFFIIFVQDPETDNCGTI